MVLYLLLRLYGVIHKLLDSDSCLLGFKMGGPDLGYC